MFIKKVIAFFLASVLVILLPVIFYVYGYSRNKSYQIIYKEKNIFPSESEMLLRQQREDVIKFQWKNKTYLIDKNIPELVVIDDFTDEDELKISGKIIQGAGKDVLLASTSDNGDIYFSNSAERVIFNKNSKNPWKIELASPLFISGASPVIYKNIIFIPTVNGLGLGTGCEEGDCSEWEREVAVQAYLYGIDMATGRVVQKYPTEGTVSLLAIYNNKLIFDSEDGWSYKLTVIDLLSEKLSWEAEYRWLVDNFGTL